MCTVYTIIALTGDALTVLVALFGAGILVLAFILAFILALVIAFILALVIV